jgi:hypothetical protein
MSNMKLFMHTAKAVRRGDCPSDRVFLVVSSSKEGRTVWHTGWKCTLTNDGLQHPAFKKPLSFDNLAKGFIKSGKNGSMPTAVFKEDSFYQVVTEADLEVRARKVPPAVGY